MGDLNSPPSRGKRTVIRRFVPDRLADFDEQVWPVNLAILVFAGFVTGIVLATTPNFFDPRPLYNGLVRLGIIAGLVLLLLWSTAHVQAPTARRIQFCVVLSLFLHLLVAVLLREQYLKLIAFIREHSLPAESESEETITLPDYATDTIEEGKQLSEYSRPVQALPRENAAVDQLIDRSRPSSPASLPPPQETSDVSQEKPSPLVPPRTEDTAREQSSDSQLSPPRRPMPAPAEITHTAPLDAPPQEFSAQREMSPRDQVQREQTTPTLRQPEESLDQSINPDRNLPARVAVEHMPADSLSVSRPQPREVTSQQSLASQSPSITVPEPQAPPGQLRPPEIVPQRSQTISAPVQVTGETQPVTPAGLAATNPAPRPARISRPEISVGPVGTQQTLRGVERSSVAAIGESAELQSIPQTAGISHLARSPEEPQLGGPARERSSIPSSGAPGSTGDLADIVNASPGGRAASRRPRALAASDLAGTAGTGDIGASPPRKGGPGEILGSVASLAPTEPEPSGTGGANLRGAAARLEPRATGIGPAPTSVGLAPRESGTGSSESRETGGGLASELTGGMGVAISGPARGLGAAREQGETVGQAFAMGNTRLSERGIGESSHPMIAGRAALEGTVPETLAGPTGAGIPSDRPSAMELTYGQGTSRNPLPSFTGFGSSSASRPRSSDLADIGGVTVPGVSGGPPPRLFVDRTAFGGDTASTGIPGESVRSSAGLRGQENAPHLVSQAPIAAETGGTSQASPFLAPVQIGREVGDGPRRVVDLPPLASVRSRGGSPSGTLLQDGPTLPARRGGGELPRPEIVGPGGTRLASRSLPGVPSSEVLRGAAETEPAEAFAQRNPESRGVRAREFGGSSETERAVEKGLEFLARIQFADGHWSLHRLPDHVPDPQKTFHTGTMHGDTAATGMALLAFLGAGYTHQGARYRDTVARGLRWLVENQLSDGRFFHDQTDSNQYTRFYGHGLATIAVCEAYGMTRDPALRQPAERAIEFIVKSQNPELGGWRYESRKETDTSVTGWQLMALKSAQMAGLQVPATTLHAVSRWLDRAQVEGGARYVYSPYAGGSSAAAHLAAPNRAMTAEGLLMRIYLGWGPENPALQRGADFLAQNLPSYGNPENPLRDAYYWYYATQVMFQMQGEHWKSWNQTIQQLLLREQVQSGPWAGSWDPLRSVPDRWANEAGRLYVTAMHLLILEVYYRHLPLFRTLAQKD
ncbi:hypothetical protein [Thermogutta sp.]|uniref:prenyltransferase/squalene oxidase repeat-containing protein n=1 Tax=Thermogutta sp. TaxID=1962930 RepID=UPI003C7C8CC7